MKRVDRWGGWGAMKWALGLMPRLKSLGSKFDMLNNQSPEQFTVTKSHLYL